MTTRQPHLLFCISIMTSPLGAGDIIAIVTLIKNVYSDCKDAGENYKHVTSQLYTLIFIVKDIDELIKTHKTHIGPQKELEMRAIVGHCADVIRTLKANLALIRAPALGLQGNETLFFS